MEILGLPYWEDVSLTKFKEALLIFFSKAKKEVFMSTRLKSDFYNLPEIIESITEKTDEGVLFRIVIDKDGQEPPDWMTKNNRIQTERSTVKILQVIVIDNKHFMIESSSGSFRICYNVPVVVRVFKDDLQEIWDNHCEESPAKEVGKKEERRTPQKP